MPWALVAAAVGAIASAYGARQQNKAAQEAATRQMDFQERMSGTSYQRSMDDMRAAGLNSILAYQQGGATSPAGTQPNVVNPMGTEMSGVASTAVQLRRQKQELKAINSTIELQDAARYKTEQETILTDENIKTERERRQNIQNQSSLYYQQYQHSKATTDTAQSLADLERQYKNILMGKPWLQLGIRSGSAAGAGIGLIKSTGSALVKGGRSIYQQIQKRNRR